MPYFYSDISNPMLKTALKQIPIFAAANAYLKSRDVKKRYLRTAAHYSRIPAAGTAGELLQRRGGERLTRFRQLKHPPRIMFLGTDEQQDRSGIIQALEQFGELCLFTRADGSYGQNHPGTDVERVTANTRRLLDIVERARDAGATPDLVIAQTWANFIDPTAINMLRQQFRVIFVNIGMDDRHQYWGRCQNGHWGGTYGLIPVTDLALTSAPECVHWYLAEGCPAVFFPEASDPSIFHPMPHLPKIHEVSFVGGRYGIRERIVRALMRQGIRVSAYGSGWSNGRIPTADVPQLFAQSKIVLGVGTIGHCTDFYSLKMRDFDAPMSGSLYVTHDNKDLHRLYDIGREIVTYGSLSECVREVRHYVDDDVARERVARAGHARAAAAHTWQARFGNLFSLLMQGDLV